MVKVKRKVTGLLSLVLLLTISSVASADAVKVAKPRAYTAEVTAEQLGVNANGKGLERGVVVQNAVIKDIQGKSYELKSAWQKKPALVIFYRGGWCPFCNMQVRELAENYSRLNAAGVQPLLISVDAPDKSAMVSAQYKVPFPVLSDPDLVAHKAFNVVLTLDAATLEKYKGYGINLEAWSGKKHNSIGVASVFLIDTTGKVLVSHAPEDYSIRPSVDQLLAMIKQYTKK